MKQLLPLFIFFLALPVLTSPAFAQNKAPDPRSPQVLIARDDTVSSPANTPVTIDALENDEETNIGREIIDFDILTGPKNGTAEILRNGTPGDVSDDVIRYIPDTDFTGADSLVYQIENSANFEQEATVRIFIQEGPDARNDTVQVEPADLTVLDVLANDVDPEGDAITIEAIVESPDHGAVSIRADKKAILYDPVNNYLGQDTLRYAITDGNGGRDSAWVYITVNAQPTAVNDTTSTTPGTSVSVSVLANDSDPTGEDLTVSSIATPPEHGTATIISGGNQIRYSPANNFAGQDSLQYVAMDENGGRDSAWVFFTVNTVPTAEDDTAETLANTPITVDVLDNDDDPDNQALTIAEIAEGPEHGTASIVNNEIRYTPDADFGGADSLRYVIEDPQGATATAWLFIDVMNDAVVQFIHTLSGLGVVDIFVDDQLVVNDLAEGNATAFVTVPSGEDLEVDIVVAGFTVESTTLTLMPETAYIALAVGTIASPNVIILEDARMMADDENEVDVLFVNGIPGAEEIDIRELDPNDNNDPAQVLANDLAFGELTPYRSLDPSSYNLDIANATGTTQYEAFRVDFSGQVGEPLVVIATGQLAGDVNLRAYTVNGTLLPAPIVTDTEGETELPTEFALDGNYPNPFNPSTTIQFDLPETAEVSIEIVDMLGRSVMTLPVQMMEAGANRTMQVNAVSLASGNYLYRVIAKTATDTMIKTGRMTLVK